MQLPAVVEFDEDSEARTTLVALRCANPSWALEGTSTPDYQPVLEGNVLVHRYAPDRSGGGAVTVRLRCDGSAEVRAALAVVVRPQPDIGVTLHEVTGADQLITAPLRVAVNGVETAIGPGGGHVQFRQGANQLQLIGNPGWRSLQVWEINGQVIPLNEAGTGFPVTITGTGDDGTAVVRMLHATAHAWYRAGTASEADVRAVYWSEGSGGIGTGFVGFTDRQLDGGRPIFTQLGPLVVDGVEVCSAVPASRYFDYQAAVEAHRAPYLGMSVPIGWRFAESLENLTMYSSMANGELVIANGWSLACDAPVSVVDEYYRPGASGHVQQLVIRIPAGGTHADRVAALWRLPRRMGHKVPGSAWVSSTAVPGPADLEVARHFFPLADAAAQRGMPPLRF